LFVDTEDAAIKTLKKKHVVHGYGIFAAKIAARIVAKIAARIVANVNVPCLAANLEKQMIQLL
jgi:hypothetical protein